MVYTIIKEASLVLLDACQCPENVAAIKSIAKSIPNVKDAHSVRLRKLGSYIIGDMHVEVDSEMTVKEAAKIAAQIEEKTKKQFDDIIEVNVIVEPEEAKQQLTRQTQKK
jgi:divalent metal cation (Fe/Co/Zn/Cd) transporter